MILGVLLVICTIMFVLFITDFLRTRYVQIQKKEYEKEQTRLKKELEPLMKEIQLIMKGEVFAEKKTPLALFNYSKESYPDVIKIDADAELVEAELTGDEGNMTIKYEIEYYDINGECKMKANSLNQMIKIKKIDGKWQVIKIINPA